MASLRATLLLFSEQLWLHPASSVPGPLLSEEGVQGVAPSTQLRMRQINLGAGLETGADLCTYNEVEEILFTRIPLKDSPEYIWVKTYFSKPLGEEGETQDCIQARRVIINLLCMR